MSMRLVSAEGRVCGVLVVVLLVGTSVVLRLLSWPLLLALTLPSAAALCQVASLTRLSGLTNCSETWNSCQDSCSSPSFHCLQVSVRYWLTDNTTSVLPLFANVLGCGLDFELNCSKFYERFSVSTDTFACHIYSNPNYAIPYENKKLQLLKYFVISLIPVLVLILCLVYMKKRNLFAQGFKKAKKIIKQNPKGPKSFYQKKLMELEFKKNLRLLKMKNTLNDVKVFDLDHAQTTGALILKPRFSFSQTQPPRIIV